MLTVIALVALRLTIGWHFFYEGVWKVANSDEFSALPFLNLAKGPFAPIFYSMTPDLEGRIRMQLDEKTGTIPCAAYKTPWLQQRQYVENKFNLTDDQKEEIEVIYNQYADSLDTFLAAKYNDVKGYFVSLDLLNKDKRNGNDGPEQRKRQWDEMMKLRGEMNGWIGAIEGLGDEMTAAFEGVLTQEQLQGKHLPKIIPTTDRMPWGITFPFASYTDFLNFAITWALTAIGFCLIVGFCTRLANLGGAAFLCMVCATQPAWPTIYPFDHPILGHALIVDKNFVEMIAMIALATLPVGRWGGLDWFVWNWFGKPILKAFGFTQWTEEE
ncbi:MAG: hypothetical protein IKX40_03790 [Thermoguttaceae bacterium]|nr:hypothetical protein [Thermoguttaceae bacterium]